VGARPFYVRVDLGGVGIQPGASLDRLGKLDLRFCERELEFFPAIQGLPSVWRRPVNPASHRNRKA
jgi:hypothetical protein